MKILVFMQGIPDSGKSFLAAKIKSSFGDRAEIFSTNDFWIDSEGKYNFNWNMLAEAHRWNEIRVHDSMSKGTEIIVIDNTNLRNWEIFNYKTMARDFKYKTLFSKPGTPWQSNVTECFNRNVHGVAKEKISEMFSRMEKLRGGEYSEDIVKTLFTLTG